MTQFIISFSILYISLYLPVAWMAYFVPWYTYNTTAQISSYLGAETVTVAHYNLTNFFRHADSLHEDFWSKKEILHMYDVRMIYDCAFFIFVACIAIILCLTFWSNHTDPQAQRGGIRSINRSARYNLFLIPLFFLLIPVFPSFWAHIFHDVLFTNDLWLMLPSDLSYHLFPLSFFVNSLLLLIVTAFLINIAIFVVTRRIIFQRAKPAS